MKTSSAALALVAPAPPPAAAPEAFGFGPFRVLAGVDLLFRGDSVVPLEPRAVCVLRHLVRQAGHVVRKEELLDVVWPETYVTDGVLKKAVSQIRRALDDPPQQSRFIETWHRRGYRFIAAVETTAVERAATPPPPLAPVESDERDLDFDQLAGRDTEMEALCAEYRRTLARQGTPLLVLGEEGFRQALARWQWEEALACAERAREDAAESVRLAVAALERCEKLLDAARAPLGSPADRRAMEEVRRAPVADLHRLLAAAGETARAGELRRRWPAALGGPEGTARASTVS